MASKLVVFRYNKIHKLKPDLFKYIKILIGINKIWNYEKYIFKKNINNKTNNIVRIRYIIQRYGGLKYLIKN